jgi:glycosyltransferase involved in cell wall biosynthesis
LDLLKTDYRIIAINDGSKDNTLEQLQTFLDDDRLLIVDKQNEGHGMTLIRAYSLVVNDSTWVFQVDSDNELLPDDFPSFWRVRNDYDIIIGFRTGRRQPLGRRLISAVSRLTVAAFCGTGVSDVNCPYRLMRGSVLATMLDDIPANTFAPNVAISGLSVMYGYKIKNLPAAYQDRQTGAVSLMKWNLIRSAVLSFLQTSAVFVKAALKRRRHR